MIRSSIDWVVRYGGEEFLIVIPETDLEGANAIAERLCAAVSQLVTRADGHEIRITASFRGAGFNPNLFPTGTSPPKP